MLLLISLLLTIGLVVFSYGFVDLNLVLSQSAFVTNLLTSLREYLLHNRVLAAVIYVSLILSFYLLYQRILRAITHKLWNWQQILPVLLGIVILLLTAFPAFSYDIFNYMLTARVTFHWKENPWITMPIEIANEPALAYTRAANKTALYGPSWIIVSALPSLLGHGDPWLTIILFKLLVTSCYGLFLWLIYRQTRSLWQTMFFAFNPLILMEVIVSGHNDILMILLAISSILLFSRARRVTKFIGLGLWLASIFVKGATVVMLPLFVVPKMSIEKLCLAGYWLMFAVFLLTPLREEMYPWYAVWWLGFLVFLPLKKYHLLYAFSSVFSLGLILRHAPYILMGYYEGIGPALRLTLMLLPVVIWLGIERKAIGRQIIQIYRFIMLTYRRNYRT
jgi:hypothetical protein